MLFSLVGLARNLRYRKYRLQREPLYCCKQEYRFSSLLVGYSELNVLEFYGCHG